MPLCAHLSERNHVDTNLLNNFHHHALWPDVAQVLHAYVFVW